jgi:hypothetical protein
MSAAKRIDRKTWSPGVVSYYGKPDCPVEIEWSLTEDGRFSMSGAVWMASRRDCYTCRQCLDEIAKLFPKSSKVQQMHQVWKRWHLNDLRAGCEHQRAEGWGQEQLVVKTYTTTTEAYQLREKGIGEAVAAALEGRVAVLTPEQRYMMGPDWFRDVFDLESHPLPQLFKLKKEETKQSNWVHQHEHPRGVLSKPCPVCGYRYGSAWLKEEIPEAVLAVIRSW